VVGGGFSLSRRSRVDGGDEDQLPGFLVLQFTQDVIVDFSLVFPVTLKIVFVDGKLGRNLLDELWRSLLRNFNITFEAHGFPPALCINFVKR